MGSQAIGVVFDIDGLGGGFYGYEAWKIFATHVKQQDLQGCELREGDTSETLMGSRNEFCIAADGVEDAAVIKEAFAALDLEGLSPRERRFIEGPQLAAEPLVDRGWIDSEGFWCTASWTRIDHDLSKHAGWKYRPQSVPDDLPAELQEELRDLMGD